MLIATGNTSLDSLIFLLCVPLVMVATLCVVGCINAGLSWLIGVVTGMGDTKGRDTIHLIVIVVATIIFFAVCAIVEECSK